jgi:hypothetical protein
MEWVLGMQKCEVIVNGRRQGAPKPKNGEHDLKSRYEIPRNDAVYCELFVLLTQL